MADDLKRLHRLAQARSRAAQARHLRAKARADESATAHAEGRESFHALCARLVQRQRERIDGLVGRPVQPGALQQLALGHALTVQQRDEASLHVIGLALASVEAGGVAEQALLDAKTRQQRETKLEQALERDLARKRIQLDVLQEFEAER